MTPLQLPAEATIIDGGANAGQFIERCYEEVHHPRIVAIEMLLDLAAETQRRHPNVAVLNCALRGRCGQAEYLRMRQSQMSSLLAPTKLYAEHYPESDCAVVDSGHVLALTLDTVADILMLGQIDLLKLDLQGGELDALCGAMRLLKRTRNIVCECELVELYRGQPLIKDIFQFMSANGFQMRRSLEDHYRAGFLVAQDLWFSPAEGTH